MLLRLRRGLPMAAMVGALAGCATEPAEHAAASMSPEQARDMIARQLPSYVTDRNDWSGDIYDGFVANALQPTPDASCAVIAVIEQESSFRTNPTVPGLPAIARREIDRQAEDAGIPTFLVHAALQLPSRGGRSFGERIDQVKTEKDLSDIFEDFISGVPMGKRLFGDHNPIRTRGPMQVNVSFATRYAATRPYPYAIKDDVANELFTRRGGLYFGIAHLFAYSPPYDDFLYRFADFNAGQFASRNAAFQQALGLVSGVSLKPDGALVATDAKAKGAGSTARAAHAVARRLNLNDDGIDVALEKGKSKDFEDTALYQRVFDKADELSARRNAGRRAPRAVVPRIELHGAKLSRTLTTGWYAHRVDERFKRCLSR
jgi:hypothetical protein